MSKNLTLKGAAFGALVALSVSAVAPASAAGLADTSFVSLAPSSGTAYTVVAGAGKTFSLTSNEASTVAGGDLKFLVSDASDKVEVTTATTGRAITVADNSATLITIGAGATDTIKITDATLAAQLSTGDVISFDANLIGDGNTSITTLASGSTAFQVTVSGNDVTFTTDLGLSTEADLEGAINGAVTGEVIREARNTTDHNFVVDSGTHTAASNSTLVLKTTESTVVTRSVDVTAWVDSNDNDSIDSTEYVSPTRTVKFIKGSEVTATTAIDPLIIGSTSIVAHVTTTPALNGQQMSNGDVNALFTFQGSSVEFTPATSAAVFNTTSGKWDVTATRSGSISGAANVALDASVLTSNGHGLTDGEKVTIAGLTAAGGTTTGLNGTKTVASSTANTFSIGAGSGTGVVSRSSATWTVQIVAGSYSARAKIGSDFLQAAATSGSATAVTAATGKAVIATGVNVISDGATAPTATVRPSTLAASATWTFKDADTATVTAGRPVKVTVTTVTGVTGLKINGTAAAQGDVIDLATDAAGAVTANITTTAAVATDSVVLTAVAEGVSGTSTAATFNWTAATNTLYDLNSTSSVYRSIAKGGTYTFNFAVTDNWKQLVTGDYRLRVATSGNTVSETYPSIASGTASVSVTDNQISSTGDVTVVVTPQKKQTDGTWATTGAPSAVTYYLKPAAQSGAKVTAITADATADFSTTAVAAGDTRNSQASVTADGTAGTDAVEVTGVVTNALNGVVVPGAAVTVSGSADLLFVDGAKAAFGSIVVYADENGAYSVNVRSNKAAVDTLVTASALGASSTALKITFLKAKADTGKTLTVSAPTTAIPGSTITVTVSLKDAFGNAVVTDSTATGYQVGSTTPTTTVTYTGPGYVTSTIPTVTDANGTIKFVVLLGTGDSGTATVSAAYDSNGSTANVAGTTLTATATATVAVQAVVTEPSAVVNVVGHRVYVKFNDSKGEEVSAVIGGVRITKIATYNGYVVSKLIKKAGKVAVKAYVAGDLVKASTVTVK